MQSYGQNFCLKQQENELTSAECEEVKGSDAMSKTSMYCVTEISNEVSQLARPVL